MERLIEIRRWGKYLGCYDELDLVKDYLRLGADGFVCKYGFRWEPSSTLADEARRDLWGWVKLEHKF